MFKVTLPGPVFVSPDNLSAFLAIAGAAQVEQASTAHAAPDPEEPNKGSTVTSMAPPRRGRPAKETPKEEPKEEPTPPAGNHNRHNLVDAAPAIDRDTLLAKFTDLVDADYDKALEALTSFGVTRFSEIPDEKLADFAKAIS